MNIRQFSVGFIFCVLVVLIANEAFPNGMSPPRPSRKPSVTVNCQEKHRDLKHQIFLVQVKNGDHSSNNLTFQINSINKEIAIADIKTVSLCAGEADRDGFITATFVAIDGVEEKSAKVQVITPLGNVKLAGYTYNGKEYSIDLSDCKIVEFSRATVEDYKKILQPKH